MKNVLKAIEEKMSYQKEKIAILKHELSKAQDWIDELKKENAMLRNDLKSLSDEFKNQNNG